MSWILYAFLMFIASNFLYLLIRKAQIEKVGTDVYSISMFLVPAIAYLILSMTTNTSILVSLPNLLLIVFAAIFWSYLGNFFSQRGILFAPNPGYSLILSKSYVILTTIVAFFLFSSELNLKRIIGILIIIAFSAIISISKERKKADFKWVFYSLGAFLCWGFGSLISKHFLNIGLQPYTYLFYICSIVSILNILEAKFKKTSVSLNKLQWLVVVLIGISSIGFNLFMQFGYKFSPNPGYVAAINVSSIMSITLFSSFLFKDSLSIKKIVGVLGVITGLVIMFV